jgi:molecular chaperone DnaK
MSATFTPKPTKPQIGVGRAQSKKGAAIFVNYHPRFLSILYSVFTTTANSRKTANIKITGSTGLSKEEVEKMKQEAEKNAATDKEAREKIDAKNHADSLIYQAEKALSDAKDKVPAEVKTEVEGKIKALKDILESGSKEDLEAKSKELQESMMKIGAAQGVGGQPGEQAPSANGQAPNNDQAASDKKDGKVEEGQVVG